MNKTILLICLFFISKVLPNTDTNNVYSSSPTAYITINDSFNKLFIKNIDKVNIFINSHKRFGDSGQEYYSTTSYYKEEIIRIENDGNVFWSTLFMHNIDSIYVEDTTEINFMGSFCCFDTLYRLEMYDNTNKCIVVYFSHFDLHDEQFRIIKNSRLYLLKLNKKIIPVLNKHIKELYRKINNFQIPIKNK